MVLDICSALYKKISQVRENTLEKDRDFSTLRSNPLHSQGRENIKAQLSR